MTKITIILAFILSINQLIAEETKTKTMEFLLPDGATYLFSYPDTVSAKISNPPKGIPPSIKAVSANRKMSLQITFFPPGANKVNSQEFVSSLVLKSGKKEYENSSVEKSTTVVPLKIKDGIGAIAQYTDADLANVPNPGPGQFKVVGNCAIVIGGTLAVVTLMGDSFESADYKMGLSLITEGFSKK